MKTITFNLCLIILLGCSSNKAGPSAETHADNSLQETVPPDAAPCASDQSTLHDLLNDTLVPDQELPGGDRHDAPLFDLPEVPDDNCAQIDADTDLAPRHDTHDTVDLSELPADLDNADQGQIADTPLPSPDTDLDSDPATDSAELQQADQGPAQVCLPPGPWCTCTGPALELSQAHQGGAEKDWGLALAMLPAGAGFVVAGETSSKGQGLADAWLLAWDQQGQFLWDRTYGGPEWDTANAVVALEDGRIALAGSTKSKGAGLSDAWLVITDLSGQPLQEKLFGDQWGDSAKAMALLQDGFLLAGVRVLAENTPTQAWLLRLDPAADLVWEQTYGAGLENQVTDLAVTADGGAVIAGRRMSTGFTGWDPMLIRTDAQGNLLWETVVVMEMDDEGQQVLVLPDGSIALYGSNKSKAAGAWDAWLALFDENGTLLWDQTYGDDDGEIGRAMALAPGGDFLLVGQTYSWGTNGDAWVVRTDTDGNILWHETCGGPGKETPWAVTITSDARLVMAGTSSSYGDGSDDVWLAILDLTSCP